MKKIQVYEIFNLHMQIELDQIVQDLSVISCVLVIISLFVKIRTMKKNAPFWKFIGELIGLIGVLIGLIVFLLLIYILLF